MKNIGGEKMQKRYCSICGFPVWVQYRLFKNDSDAVFWSNEDPRAAHLTKCPCCWERFDIDMLS